MQGSNGMKADFAKYPKYEDAYIRAFDKMIESRKKKGLEVRNAWADGKRVMRWWLGENPDQITIDDWLSEREEI